MMTKVAYKKLVKKGFTIAFSESMTGGFVSAELVKIPGASKVFLGSIVAYQKASKKDVLEVPKSVLDTFPLVSHEVAIEMAKQACTKFKSDVGVGVTGNAGPSFEPLTYEKKAVVSIKILDHISVYEINLSGLTRIQSIRRTTQFVYQKLDELIL